MEHLKKREKPTDEEPANGHMEISEAEKKGDFRNFPISEATARNLQKKGISYLFPIQVNTFGPIYDGLDLIGRDRTGSGKTLAFALPILEKLRRKEKYFSGKRGQKPYILCLVPTRELAIQVSNEFVRFKNKDNEYRVLSIYGGTDIHAQMDALRNGVEVVIGTPGRVFDLLERKCLSTRKLKHMILDETDQMLNIGFQEDIEKILKKIKEEFEENKKSIDKIQFLLFSATIPKWVDKIASKFMKDNVVRIDNVKNSGNKTSKTVEHLSLFVPSKEHKIPAIGDILLVYGGAHSRTIIFTDKKEEANEVMLHGQLKVESQVLHGDIPQKQREVTFKSFREGKLKCLIATNVAARGLDIPEVDLIIQLSPPSDVETYIHRSGRTGRAGKSGVCVTFYTKRQQELMEKIEVKAHIKFKKIGSPQPSDIMRATARDVAVSLDNVSSDVLQHFSENAKEILEKYSSDEAVSRAIAIISGYTQSVKQRSLLCSIEGFITYLMEVDYEVRSTSYFWSILKKHYAPNVIESIKGMKFLSNHKGVVFDLKEDLKEAFEEIAETMKKHHVTISQAKTLPEFEERDYNGNYSNGNSFGRGRDGPSGNSFGRGRDGPSGNSFGRGRDGSIGNNYGRGRDGFSGNGNENSAGKDDSKLFVSNLSYDTNEKELKDFIEGKGYNPSDVYIVKNFDKTSKGFGYIKFSDEKQAKFAMSELSKARINGRQLRVDFADRKN
jgi:ATP-dependent RNA helicase DDX21